MGEEVQLKVLIVSRHADESGTISLPQKGRSIGQLMSEGKPVT